MEAIKLDNKKNPHNRIEVSMFIYIFVSIEDK